jgi:excisionase family DNA binding protein
MAAPRHPPSVLSTSQAASELGVSERTLRRYIQAGVIGFRRLPGGHYRIPREAIEDFWSEHAPRARLTGRRAPLVARPRPRAGHGPNTDGASKRRPRLSAETAPRAYEIPLRSRPS